MKQKTLLIMTLISTLLGCGNKISGPDFEHQENKVIVLNDNLRIDYQIPGNLSLFLNFAKKHKQQPKSINIDNIDDQIYETDDWKHASNLDIGIWEYYRGKRDIEKNIAAHLSISIDIIKVNNAYSTLEELLEKTYATYLDGENGLNTKTRSHYIDYSDDELGKWLVKAPEFENIKTNKTNYISWHTYGEISGRHLKYFAFPIDNKHFITIRFKYYFTAKNDSELNKLKTMIPNDIDSFMSQLHISTL